MTELQWRIIGQSPQIDEIQLLEVSGPSVGISGLLNLDNQNFYQVSFGPFHVPSNLSVQVSDDLLTWEEKAMHWGVGQSIVHFYDAEARYLELPKRFYRVVVVP